jgi:hypothetical protein
MQPACQIKKIGIVSTLPAKLLAQKLRCQAPSRLSQSFKILMLHICLHWPQFVPGTQFWLWPPEIWCQAPKKWLSEAQFWCQAPDVGRFEGENWAQTGEVVFEKLMLCLRANKRLDASGW